MNALIVYYSRTGNTEKIAEILKEKLECDIEKISDNNTYKGAIGFLKGGFNAVTGRGCEINHSEKNPEDYDLVILGGPVWAGTVAAPMNTYIMENRDKFKSKLACFVTAKSGGYEETIADISKRSNKSLTASMYLLESELENPSEKINTFIDKVTK